jgi:TatD DNase family protein
MNLKIFDAHCHLQMPQFDADRGEVLARMREKGVGAVVVGTDLDISKKGVALAEKHDFLWASVGLHPNDNPTERFDAAAFEALAQHPKVVAIGECGLDYFRSGGTDAEKMAQRERFLAHIDLARKIKKPLIIHCRDAHDDMLELLRPYSGELGHAVPVVIHFFTGSGELAQKYLDLGCHLSFPGPITYAEMYDESIRVAPLERILTETDSPFAAPVPYRGKRNEPVYVEEIVKKIATVKGLSFEETAHQIALNSQRIFGLQ